MSEAEQMLRALRAAFLNRLSSSLLKDAHSELPDNVDRNSLRILVEEGLVTEVPGNSHYRLSYAGMCEYSRLNYRRVMGMSDSYFGIRKRLRAEFTNLAAQGVQRIAIYGTGMVAEAAHGALSALPLTLAAVVSDHRNLINFYQFKLEPPEILVEMDVDKILPCTYLPRAELIERFSRLGISEDRLLSVKLNPQPTDP